MEAFQELDDACLSCVLGHLSSAKDLVKAQVACKRLRSVGVLNKLWVKWIYSDFGLPVAPTQCARPGAAQQLYIQLRSRKTYYALHATAISTDGSCDEPYAAFWADNMFTYKSGVMYCSSSGTANIHVFARLSPASRPMPAISKQLPVPPAPLTESQHRAFLLDRCKDVAARLIHPATLAVWQSELQQQGLLDKARQQQVGIMGMLLRRMSRRSEDSDLAATVRNILESCSTEGLVEFFLECFFAQAQGKPWAAPLYSGLDENGQQLVRWMALNEIEHASEPRSQSKLQQYLLSPRLPATPKAPAAATATAAAGTAEPGAPPAAHVGDSGVAQQRQQQVLRTKQRQLLCAEDQLQELVSITCPGQNTCIIHECILARDGFGGSTCPISSGLLYLKHYFPDCRAATPHSSHQHVHKMFSSAAAAASTDEWSQEAAAVSMLSTLTAEPWVSASDGLTTAQAVLTAAAAGQLPPVLDYACSKQGEWVEFEPPSHEQAWRQLQQVLHTAPSCNTNGAAGGSCGCAVGASISHTCVMCPVLWFRFYPRREVWGGGGGHGLVQVMLGQQQQQHHHQQQYPAAAHHLHQAADSGQAGRAAARIGAAHTHAAMAQRPMPAAAAAIAAARAAVRHCTPREQSRSALCEAMPELPVEACEVSAALGYYPTNRMHSGHMAIQLKQPRAGNMVCVKLLNCEDVKPDFNRERGGCNIDMQLVMLRGHELGCLPSGLAFLATAGGAN